MRGEPVQVRTCASMVLASILCTFPLLAQAPSAPPSAPGARLELDVLAGAFVHRTDVVPLFAGERIDADAAVGVSGTLRLRIPIASGAWAVLVGGTIGRTGTAYTVRSENGVVIGPDGRPAPSPAASRTHAVGYDDLVVGIERRWAVGRSTAILTSLEAGYAQYRSRASRCTEPAVPVVLGGCEGPGSAARGDFYDAGAAVIPAVGIARRIGPDVALTALVRPTFVVSGTATSLSEFARTAPVNLLVGLRLGTDAPRD